MRNEELLKLMESEEGHEPFTAKEFYRKMNLGISEWAFCKSLERLVKGSLLLRISKGVYCLPINTEFGLVRPSSEQIAAQYISENRGMKIGYQLYNELNLTTQISKRQALYSNALSGRTKTIGEISVKKVNLSFDEETRRQVAFLEVLSHFGDIEDLNLSVFRSYSEDFAKSFSEESFNEVTGEISYKKCTIAFLREILNHFGVANNLEQHLSPLSTYKHPRMEEIYGSTSR